MINRDVFDNSAASEMLSLPLFRSVRVCMRVCVPPPEPPLAMRVGPGACRFWKAPCVPIFSLFLKVDVSSLWNWFVGIFSFGFGVCYVINIPHFDCCWVGQIDLTLCACCLVKKSHLHCSDLVFWIVKTFHNLDDVLIDHWTCDFLEFVCWNRSYTYTFYTVKYIMDSREGTDMVELAGLIIKLHGLCSVRVCESMCVCVILCACPDIN